MKSRLLGALCACVFTFVSTSTNAARVSRLGGQAVYDTDFDITWLADANAGAGSAFDDGGLRAAVEVSVITCAVLAAVNLCVL